MMSMNGYLNAPPDWLDTHLSLPLSSTSACDNMVGNFYGYATSGLLAEKLRLSLVRPEG